MFVDFSENNTVREGMETESLSGGGTSENEFYKVKYRELKKTLKRSVGKNEYLKSELKMNQKKLQILEEDKYFLMERLLNFEKPPESPEPLSQELSDSDQETSSNFPVKKSKSSSSSHPGGVTFSSAFSKVKPLRQPKKSKKPRVGGALTDFLDSPSCFANLEDEDSSSFAMDGGVELHSFPTQDDDDSDSLQ